MLNLSQPGIYKIVNTINNKAYIGSSKNVALRYDLHLKNLRKGRHVNPALQKAFKKYGEAALKLEILEICSEDELLTLEQLYLDLADFSNLYNISRNSGGGDNISYHPENASIRLRQSSISKARWQTLSEEERNHRRESLRGEKNPNYGNRWTSELRQQASDRLKSNPKTSYRRGKTFEDLFSPEMVSALKSDLSEHAKARIGPQNPFYGKQHSDVTRERLRKAHQGRKKNPSNKKIVVLNGIAYRSQSTLAKALGVADATITHRIKCGRYPDYRYLDDLEMPNDQKQFVVRKLLTDETVELLLVPQLIQVEGDMV